MKAKPRFRHRLIGKIFFLLVATGLIANGIVFLGGRFVFQRSESSERLLRRASDRLLDELANDIGSPPRQSSIEKFAHDWDVLVRVESRDRNQIFTSSPHLPDISQLPAKRRHGSRFGRWDNYLFLVHWHRGYRYAFFIEQKGLIDFDETLLISLAIGGITSVIVLSFGGLRYLLRPMRYLHDATVQLASGNLQLQVPVKSKDELGVLSESFNHMIVRLRETIDSKEQLLLDVSHELRSPLTRMKLALEFLPNDDRKHGLTEDVRAMEQLVNELLETARIKSGLLNLNIMQLDLQQLAQDTAKRVFNDDTKITWTLLDRANIECDPEKIALVFKNIFENSRKYARPDAPLEIDIGFKTVSNQKIQVDITDNGIGIAESEQEKVFEPFYRVDKARTPQQASGYGLGLGLVKRIMEKHNGQILLKCDTDYGTTVTLLLPTDYKPG